jgi:hypothetical protein
MIKTDILKMLKANLEIVNTLKDEYLTQLIDVSIKEIEREGVTFTTSEIEITTTETDDEGNETTTTTTEISYEVDDANLIVMYAAYLYRNRAVEGNAGYTTALSATGMPRMLRYALNNKILSQKMGATT